MTATAPPDVEFEIVKNQSDRLPRSGADHPPTVGLHVIPAGIVWTSHVGGVEATNIDDGCSVAVTSVVNAADCPK